MRFAHFFIAALAWGQEMPWKECANGTLEYRQAGNSIHLCIVEKWMRVWPDMEYPPPDYSRVFGWLRPRAQWRPACVMYFARPFAFSGALVIYPGDEVPTVLDQPYRYARAAEIHERDAWKKACAELDARAKEQK